MTNLIVFGLILGTILQPIVVLSQSQTFRAAIALYKLNETYKVPDEEVTENIGNYVKYIELVKDKADILIFPEYGLTTTDVMLKPAIHLDDYSTVVKDVGYQYNNCSLDDNLGKIACAAKANGVYVVLNLVEKVDAATFFVSNVAIDSTGTISMKCRKQHLNNGTSFKQAPNENSCTFTAKFKTVSTSFAVMYETDIFYAIPDDLKKDNVIMTSAIKNTLPFEYGPSLHTGFAINNNVNLLVSAYSDHKQKTNGYGGSGIYLKNGTSTLILDAISDHFLIKEIPLNADSSSKKSVSANIKGSAPGWNLAYLKASHFPNSNKSVQECLEGKNFCCKLEADIAQDNIEPYKWVILQNTSTLLNQQVDVFICALVKPAATTKTLTFRNVNVTSTVMNHHVLQTIPIGVNSNFSLPKFEYSNGRTDEVSLKLLQADELLSFGIIRIVRNGSSGSGYTGVIIGVVIGLLVVLGLAAAGYWWYKRNGGYMRPGK